jgi:hypothetical protein
MSSVDNLGKLVTALNGHLAAAVRASALLAKVRAEGRMEPNDAEIAELQAADDAADARLAASIEAAKAAS